MHPRSTSTSCVSGRIALMDSITPCINRHARDEGGRPCPTHEGGCQPAPARCDPDCGQLPAKGARRPRTPFPVVLAALCAVVLMLPIMVLRYLKYGLAKLIDEKYGGRSGPRVNMQVTRMGNWNRVARSHHTACSYAVPEALGLAQVGTHTRLERNM